MRKQGSVDADFESAPDESLAYVGLGGLAARGLGYEPISPRTGAPQIDWDVTVEHANATRCTY
jgi:hypothetical protein